MKVVLKKTVKWSTLYCGTGAGDCKEYHMGETLDVIPASNLPDDSKIKFWIVQDGWDEDAIGFGLYADDVVSTKDCELGEINMNVYVAIFVNHNDERSVSLFENEIEADKWAVRQANSVFDIEVKDINHLRELECENDENKWVAYDLERHPFPESKK